MVYKSRLKEKEFYLELPLICELTIQEPQRIKELADYMTSKYPRYSSDSYRRTFIVFFKIIHGDNIERISNFKLLEVFLKHIEKNYSTKEIKNSIYSINQYVRNNSEKYPKKLYNLINRIAKKHDVSIT